MVAAVLSCDRLNDVLELDVGGSAELDVGGSAGLDGGLGPRGVSVHLSAGHGVSFGRVASWEIS